MNSSRLVRSALTRLGLVTIVGLLGPSISHGQDVRNFWLLNNTGKVISSFYVSPHESDKWGQDTLGPSRVPHGIGTTILFSSDVRTSCVMDFKLEFTDGTVQTYGQGRNVCPLGGVQFNRSNSIGLLYPD